MAFQFRRGTDGERQSITFELGEPLFVTDTGKVYVGDGATQGGILVSGDVSADTSPSLGGNLDLEGNDIVGTGDINITGDIHATGNITADGTINLGDGSEDNIIIGGVIASSLIPNRDREYDIGSNTFAWRDGFFQSIDVDGEIRSNSIAVDKIITSDSVLFYDIDTNEVNADLRGSVFAQDSGIIVDSESGNIFATDITAQFTNSDVQGTVFAENGDVVIDKITKDITANVITSSNLIVDNLSSQKVDNPGILQLTRETADDISGQTALRYGTIEFARNDANGRLNTGAIIGYESAIIIVSDTSGSFDDTSQYITITNAGEVGIGTVAPTSKLDVRGSAVIEGELTVSALKGSVVSDDSTIIIDSVDNTITSGGYIQFGSYTDTSRPLGVNGMVIYNSTSDRFQGYQNGSWINLDDGSPA